MVSRATAWLKMAFRTLIERTGSIVAIAGEFCAQAASRDNAVLAAVAVELKACCLKSKCAPANLTG